MDLCSLMRKLFAVGLLTSTLRAAVGASQPRHAVMAPQSASGSAKAAAASASSQSERKDLLALAQRSEALGNFPEAIREYREYLARHPDDEEARFRLATVLGWNREYTESESMLRAWVANHPDDADGFLQLGRVLSWEEKFPESADEYKRALDMRPSDLDARTEYAGVLLILQRYPEALRQCQEVLSAQPANAAAEAGTIRTLIAMGEIGRAAEELAAFVRHHPQDPRIQSLQERLKEAQLARAGSSPSAQQRLQELVSRDPQSVQLRLALADQYLAKRHFDAAAEQLRVASELQPHNETLVLRRARVLSWAKKFRESIELYRQWLAEHPQDERVEMELARVLSWSRNFDASIAMYRKILLQHPDDREARLEMARVLGWDKRYDAAVAELNTLLKGNPDDFDALLALAQVYSYQGRWQDSIRAYDSALQIRPTDRDALTGKAQVLVWSGRPSAARPILENLRSKYPDDVRALVALASDENALRRPDLALKLLRQAEALAPDDSDVAAVRGAIESQLRPELTIGANYVRDTEGLNAWRYQAADFRFSISPRIRNFIAADIFPSSAPANVFAVPVSGSSLLAKRVPAGLSPAPGYLQASGLPPGAFIAGNDRFFQWAAEIEGGTSVQLNRWFSWTAGAGAATLHHGPGDLGPGEFPGSRTRFIYDAGIAFHTLHWEFTFRSSRHYWAYTPRAIAEEIHADEQSATITWSPDHRSHFALTAYHRQISPPFEIQNVPIPGSSGIFAGRVFTMHGNGGTFRATRDIVRRERVTLGLGYEGIVFGYTHPAGLPFSTFFANPGVFTPGFYQRHAATIDLNLTLPLKVRWDAHGSAGPQQILQGSDFSFSSTAGTRFDFPFGPNTVLTIGYDYYSTASALEALTLVNRAAAYHSNSVTARIHFRF